MDTDQILEQARVKLVSLQTEVMRLTNEAAECIKRRDEIKPEIVKLKKMLGLPVRKAKGSTVTFEEACGVEEVTA